MTLVWFDDMQCPFCALAAPTIADLKARYGPEKLRIVHKDFPLSFHADAQPAAEAAAVIYEIGGNDAYWKFRDRLFANQQGMSYDQYRKWADEIGVPSYQIDVRLRQSGARSKVLSDMELGKSIGVVGTPCFFVNGVKITGAQPLDVFTREIDRQLVLADELAGRGVPRSIVHLALTKAQFGQDEPVAAGHEEPPEDDPSVYRVPVAGSPVRGPTSALVTIVEFTDFECPFCRAVQATIDELRRRYGGKIRIVFKHNPLPFHTRAEPAAQLAIEARKQKGDPAFWRAHDAIWSEKEGTLDDAALERIGGKIGLDLTKLRRAISDKKHGDVIAADRDLADRLSASGTPTFFIIGRRLVGAQPIEKFTAVIDEELKKAQELLAGKKRVVSIYDELQKNAKSPPPATPR